MWSADNLNSPSPVEVQMSERTCIGLVRIGRMRLGIRASQIERVVRGPIELTPFPQAPRHVLGAFSAGGTALPCVDLAGIVRPEIEPEAARPVAFALVLRHGTGRIAAQVDEVLGTALASADQITPLQDRPEALFRELFADPVSGRVAPLLDLDRLAELEGVRVATDLGGREQSTKESDQGVARALESIVIFQIGGTVCGFPVEVVRMVERAAAALDCVLGPGIVGGFHRYRGVDCPVSDLARMLRLPASPARAVVVIEQVDRVAAFPVDSMLAVEQIDCASLGAVPVELGDEVGCLRGVGLRRDGSPLLLLDPAPLLQRAGALVAWQTDSAAEVSAEALAQRRNFLVYRAGGGALATDLTALESVFVLPPEFKPLRESDPVFLGVLQQRQRPVQLVSLARLLGRTAPASCGGLPVLAVESPKGSYGFVVDAVEFLQAAVPRALPSGGRQIGRAGVIASTIYARNGGTERTASVIELDRLVAQLSTELPRG